MASNLIAMASNLEAMASNLIAIASYRTKNSWMKTFGSVLLLPAFLNSKALPFQGFLQDEEGSPKPPDAEPLFQADIEHKLH